MPGSATPLGPTHRNRRPVVAYLRVSTDEQIQSGLGLDAQRAAVEQEAARRGWQVQYQVDEGVSGKLRNRPALDCALARLEAGEAEALVVAKMDRLGRSVIQASDVLETARRQKWDLVVLDLGMDLTTPHGKAMAQMLAVFAELERDQRPHEDLSRSRQGQRHPHAPPTPNRPRTAGSHRRDERGRVELPQDRCRSD
ncbi:recombinase family protein [Modestobacter sp. VKM Ac-2978]|uniref:recombinase family protein n=1 Tax=Modestobacter sp. VKM Ac-2978 TaxID=3004132 RepID=UPI0022AA8E90|nr:recombinase family protein [Modestobacter sp. VKM Ac-2978]MCZ2847462.1 recombinase family protein [Modestobacter sp. VKM Ac-2978]